MLRRSIMFVALVLAGALLVTASTNAARSTPSYNHFPKCGPAPDSVSVSLVLIGPCKVVPDQITKYTLVMKNNTKQRLAWARIVFAWKSLIVKSDLPFKDQNPEQPDSRVEWDFANVPSSARRTVAVWLAFSKKGNQNVTGYDLWLQAKPVGRSVIYRAWVPFIFYK